MMELVSKNLPFKDAKEVRESEGGNLVDLIRTAKINPKKDFRFADLQGVSFAGVDLDGADFFGADLSNASFYGARITDSTSFEGAVVESVIWNDDAPEDWHLKKLEGKSTQPQDPAIHENLRKTSTRPLSSLTPREEKVLRMRFGIGMSTDHTLEEVGQQFGVTRERIKQIEAKALRKLKHPKRKATKARKESN